MQTIYELRMTIRLRAEDLRISMQMDCGARQLYRRGAGGLQKRKKIERGRADRDTGISRRGSRRGKS